MVHSSVVVGIGGRAIVEALGIHNQEEKTSGWDLGSWLWPAGEAWIVALEVGGIIEPDVRIVHS